MSTGVQKVALMSKGSRPFYQVWFQALTSPSVHSFSDIAASPEAKSWTAYRWVFITALVESLFLLLVQGVLMLQIWAPQSPVGDLLARGQGVRIITLLCGVPLAAILSVLFFGIFTAFVHWIAGRFGGQGTFDQLAYSFAAIFAPFSLIASLLAVPGAIPYVGVCLNILLVLFSLYAVALEVIAARAVYKFSWAKAAGSVLIPFGVMVLGPLCLFGGGFLALQIWRSLGQA